jgi:serine/threonine-protein kinase haspin
MDLSRCAGENRLTLQQWYRRSHWTLDSAHVVQGPYPYRLLRARTARASKSEESNNASPETFSNSQQYAALVLRNGGEDLESFKDLSWKQAASIFCQIVQTLSLGEESYQFEVSLIVHDLTIAAPFDILSVLQHRDLHWGNVVIAPVEVEKEDDIDLVKGNQIELFKDATCSGVKATIIDYTLSRATIGKTLIAYDFQDQSLFNGRSECHSAQSRCFLANNLPT